MTRETREARETREKKPVAKKEEAPAPKGFIVGVFGVGLYVLCRAIEIFLDAQSLAGLVGQSVLVEWGASRLGIVWSDPKVVTTTMGIVRRVTMGLAVGYVPAALVFGILAATRSVEIVSVSHVEASVLVIGFITAALNAWRDELLHHGIVLRMLDGGAKNGGKPTVSNVFRAVACGATSAGAALGHRDANARTVFVAFCLGVVFGTLWLRDRVSAWQPFAAHTAFRFATGTLLAGGVVHLKLADNAWAGGGSTGMLGGTAAAIAIAPLAVFALFTLLSRATKSSEEG